MNKAQADAALRGSCQGPQAAKATNSTAAKAPANCSAQIPSSNTQQRYNTNAQSFTASGQKLQRNITGAAGGATGTKLVPDAVHHAQPGSSSQGRPSSSSKIQLNFAVVFLPSQWDLIAQPIRSMNAPIAGCFYACLSTVPTLHAMSLAQASFSIIRHCIFAAATSCLYQPELLCKFAF